MTVNQLSYLRYLEDQRANQAREDETRRSNLAKEKETERSNRANELRQVLSLNETRRSNFAKEAEAHRANVTNESIKQVETSAKVKELDASAALAKAKTEGQDLDNVVTRMTDMNDSGAFGKYVDTYKLGVADQLVSGIRHIGSAIGDFITDVIPIGKILD